MIFMSFKVDIELIDTDSGEILGTTTLDDFYPAAQGSSFYLTRWVDCFVRGLRKGNNLSLNIRGHLKTF